jgi:hypothetical protein
MVMRKTPSGDIYHEPPYTAEEDAEFYRRISGGPVTIVRGTHAAAPPVQTPPQPQRGAKPRAS